MQVNALSAATSGLALIQKISEAIEILEREHNHLTALVADGQSGTSALRLRQLKSIAGRLIAARAERERLSGLYAAR